MSPAPRSETLPVARRSPSAAPPNAGTAPESHAPNALPAAETRSLPPENSNPSTAKSPACHRETLPDAPPAAFGFPQIASSDPAPTKMSDTDPAPANRSAPRRPAPPAAPSPPKQTPAALRETHNKKVLCRSDRAP